MWHVDDGALHAYLDGALEEYPAAEARRVREHLDACAECRDRLDDERRVREAAASILGFTAPRVEAPTFEDLRAYVRAHGSRPGRSVRLNRLGWAASVVLALGAGWVLRGGGPAPETVAAGTGSNSVQPVVTAPPVVADRPQEASAPAGPAVEMSPVVADAPVPPVPDAPSIRVPVDVDADLVADLAVIPPVTEVAPTPPPAVDAVLPEVTTSRTVIVELPDAATDRTDPAPERRTAPGEVVTSAQSSASTPGLTLGRTGRRDQDDEPVVDDDSYSLVVPGLAVLDVRFRGDGTRPEGQVARQLLASGDTLQVVHLPPELDPDSLDPRPDGWNELVVQRSAGWIVMRARLPDAELMELMTRLLTGS